MLLLAAATCCLSLPTSAAERGSAQRATKRRVDDPGKLVVSDQPTTAALNGRLPRVYRVMAPEELATELRQLKQSARKLPEGSADRTHIEELIRAIELYEKTGFDPDALLNEITSAVAELRNLPPLQPVRFQILERNALKKFLEVKLEEDLPPGWLAEYESACKIVGAIPERTNLRKTLLSLLSEQIAGLYDDKTKKLYVLADFDLSRPLAKIILAHEICHALQDQHYNFSRMPLRDLENNDAATAALAVIEGDATILMQDYAGTSLSGSDVLKLLDVLKIDQSALNATPYFLRQQLIFPYLGGAEFLMKISYQDPDLRELAFVRVPVSTEQILHSDKYASGDLDLPTTVSIPAIQSILGKGWKRTMRCNWGEMQIKTLFEVWREWNKAKRVGEGWDGDQFVIYRKGEEYVYLWKTTWDTRKDATEFYDEYSELLRAKRYREFFANEQFGGNIEDDKTLNYEPQDRGSDARPLHIRFRRQDANVVVQISNSGQIAARFNEMDQLLLSRDPTPVRD
ncbi:MAG: hypothetical protein ACR2IE_12220 [Candidatus Sumerlaeaceae bacterium]